MRLDIEKSSEDNYIDPARRLSIHQARTLGNPNKCWYCGTFGPTEGDHFYPKSLGGKLKVRSCPACNREKSDLTPLEWINYINQRIEYCTQNKNGCSRGQYIKSGCEPDCIELKKLLRMKRATLTLWLRIRHSVKSDYCSIGTLIEKNRAR